MDVKVEAVDDVPVTFLPVTNITDLSDEKKLISACDDFFKWFISSWPAIFSNRGKDDLMMLFQNRMVMGTYMCFASVGLINSVKNAVNSQYLEFYMTPRGHESYRRSVALRERYKIFRENPVFNNVTFIFDAPSSSKDDIRALEKELETTNIGATCKFVAYFNRKLHSDIKILLFICGPKTNTKPATQTIDPNDYATNEKEKKQIAKLPMNTQYDDKFVDFLSATTSARQIYGHTTIFYITEEQAAAAEVNLSENFPLFYKNIETFRDRCTYCSRSSFVIDLCKCSCNNVLYCGKMCQINDYDRHKLTCGQTN